jgi:eukaryotic-like serine/threonine-protein kinase
MVGNMGWNSLVGQTLESGWKIIERREVKEGDSGGCFSVQFIVEKNGIRAFMKAFDTAGLLQQSGADTTRMAIVLNSINFETKLLKICRDAKTKYVAVPLEQGQLQYPEVNQGIQVKYLVFELAEQDLRRYHNYRNNIDALANLMILHNASMGLNELHKLEIAHQDLKPSNVLLFSNQASRIADLGRSSHSSIHIWHDVLQFAGDLAYAPIEVLYNACDSDWHIRRFSADLYMLGSLTSFLFTSVNITSQLLTKLDSQFHWKQWGEDYVSVVPYIRVAMREALDCQTCLTGKFGGEIKRIIMELCDPEPKRRGSPRVGLLPARFSLDRYVSMFERMVTEVRVRGVS